MRRLVFSFVAVVALVQASDPLYESARRKLDLIETRKAKRKSVFLFTQAEINAWAPIRVPDYVPRGLRNPRVELGDGSADGYALVDLLKMRDVQPSLLTKFVEGERPLKISIRLQSSGGFCTIFLDRVEIGGVAAGGRVLDFLVKTFFLPMYPEAKIDEPFELDYNIESIDIRPSGVAVKIK